MKYKYNVEDYLVEEARGTISKIVGADITEERFDDILAIASSIYWSKELDDMVIALANLARGTFNGRR